MTSFNLIGSVNRRHIGLLRLKRTGKRKLLDRKMRTSHFFSLYEFFFTNSLLKKEGRDSNELRMLFAIVSVSLCVSVCVSPSVSLSEAA